MKNNTQQFGFGLDNGSSGFTPLKNRANNNNNTKNTADPFAKSDPFSIIPSKEIKTEFHNKIKANDANNNNDRFEVNFEDEFAKTNDFNNFLKKDNDQFNNNFAKFDVFNGNSPSSLRKNEIDSFTKNLNQDTKIANKAPEKLTKFNEDYSDNFEVDLQNVLHRSLQDK